MDTRDVAAPACLQEAVIACAGTAGAVAAPAHARSVAPSCDSRQNLQAVADGRPVGDPSEHDARSAPDAPAQLLLFNRRHQYGPALGVALLIRQPADWAIGRTEKFLKDRDVTINQGDGDLLGHQVIYLKGLAIACVS